MVKLRLSLGSAISLGLMKGRLKIPFTTLYIMVGERCISNCSFCTQSREAMINEKLSRVTWYEFSEDEIIDSLENKNFSRICFQTLDYEALLDDLKLILPDFWKLGIPISVSIAPPSKGNISEISPFVDTVSIALDAANKNVFNKIKGRERGNRFEWEEHWKNLLMAKRYFKNVNTHLIVGMGESDQDLVKVMIALKNLNISTALFAFTPVLGKGKQPPIERYRMIQLSRCLIYDFNAKLADFTFNGDGTISGIRNDIFQKGISSPKCFITSGCPGCNRPFYNEEPRKIYNYPFLPDKNEMARIAGDLAKNKITDSHIYPP